MATTIEDKYLFTTAQENIVEKDWAAGSSVVAESTEFVFKLDPGKQQGKYIPVYGKVKYAPSWLKIIDEAIVNAIDHFIRCYGGSVPVTLIRVTFDKTGRVKVYNNGPGIEVVVHKVASERLGRTVYVPDFIFGELHQGSNRVKDENTISAIIGGTNGLGGKLCNCFSTDFIVETVDALRNLYYLQKWANRMKVRGEPTIIDLKTPHKLPVERTLSHTTTSFMPDYVGIYKYAAFDEKVYDSLVDIVRTRVMFAAAYVKHANNIWGRKQNIDVYFNDERMDINGMGDIASVMFPGAPIVKTVMFPEVNSKLAAYKYPWEVVCVVTPNKYESNQVSNVNGIVVREGKHTRALVSQMTEGVAEKITKLLHDKSLKFSPSHVTNNIFVMVNSMVPNPSWTGQRKDVLDTDIRKFASYKLDKTFIEDLTGKLKDGIVESIFTNINKTEGKKKKGIQGTYDKYWPARKAGGKQSSKCRLIPCEGDSAATQACIGIANTADLGFDFNGVISLGGVIINARKECTVILTSEKTFIKKSAKLTNNAFVNMFLDITGLNLQYRYDPNSPTFAKEMRELNYGEIAVMVDQDYDGDNIHGLILNLVHLFWPNLIKLGWVKKFKTPVIRAYPKKGGQAIEFYTQRDFENWSKTADIAKYEIQYYKGIGTHSREETIQMFKNFKRNLYTFYVDDRTNEFFDIYYGDDPDLRKKELGKPVEYQPVDSLLTQEGTKHISCSDYLRYTVVHYCKDNLDRKLDSAIDGQNQAGRKILNGILRAFRSNNNRKMKVAQLAGEIAKTEAYHHAEAGLADTIKGKAFWAPGGKQIPQLVPLSNFGSRKGGGSDAASARYVWTKLNKPVTDLLFPASDYHMLEFNYDDDNERCEPKFFIPIIPLALTEHQEIPAHGWNYKIWARDVYAVITNVRRLIRVDDQAAMLKMPACTWGWKGRISTIRGEPYSFGTYTLDRANNVLVITELPLRVWTNDYIAMLNKKYAAGGDIMASPPADGSDDRRIEITIKLKPGAVEKLDSMGDAAFTDGVEEYFVLRDRMDSRLNMIGSGKEVLEFRVYEAVLHYWFPFRKQMYGKRIDRQRQLLLLWIRYYKNIIRYVENCLTLSLPKKKIAEMIAALAGANYDKFAHGKLNNPKFTPTEKLEEVILRGPKASYDYLLNLSDKRKSEEALEEYKQDLAKAEADLEELNRKAAEGRFPGAAIWEEELEQLEKVLKRGQATDWLYDEFGKYKYD